MNIVFKNKGTLSLLDMTTMGDSVKRGDSSKIGRFDSGLKFAISILFRNGIRMKVYSGNFIYSFSTIPIHDVFTEKVKEVMLIKEERMLSKPSYHKHITAFSPNLGIDWKVWMAIRELYANTLDENGWIEFTQSDTPQYEKDETAIILYSNDLLDDIITSWGNYFIDESVPEIYSSNDVKIYANTSEHLKLYKQRILIFEDVNVKSHFSYDYLDASLDEMRLCNNLEVFRYAIENCICKCNDREFIDKILKVANNSYESKLNLSDSLSDTWVQYINEGYENDTLTIASSSLWKNIGEDVRCNAGRRSIRANPIIYSWETTAVHIDKTNSEIKLTFEEEIKKLCSKAGFEIISPIIKSRMDGMTCLPDIRKKCIYVTSEFKLDNLWEIIKAQFRIDSTDDINYVYKQYVKLLNK